MMLFVLTGLSLLLNMPQEASSDDWMAEESVMLTAPVQLTGPDRFHKAGEAYFSPDDQRIIFQAVEVPEDPDQDPDPFYAMFVADLVRNADGSITGIDNITRISPDGSANTCGWFDPIDPSRVLFASTVGPPTESTAPGYQRGSGRYRWMFPPQMKIVACHLEKLPMESPPDTLEVLVGDDDHYQAEGSLDPTGRFLLYCSLESNQGDLLVMDTKDGQIRSIVSDPGYDGGPFFSPDGRRICYRSDRAGNNLLQIYVADLDRDDHGMIQGINCEYQLTDDPNVNWCPYWHPDGKHIVFATSRMGHRNYEIFIVDAASDDESGAPRRRYGTNLRRVTHAPGADVLPVFNSDGSIMMWTSQRGETGTSQLWLSPFEPAAPTKDSPSRGRP